MKKITILFTVITLLFVGACKKENTDPPAPLTLSEGVFIVNQGNFTVGNSSLSYFEPIGEKQYNNLFSYVNNIPLGDVAQSILIDDETAYIVVNNSGVIHAIDRWTAVVKGKISEVGSPRYMVKISDTKAYVSDFFKHAVTIVNPTTYEVTGVVSVGRSTEEMVQFGSEVFAANWSEFNQTMKNNKVLVIDHTVDMMTDSISVGIEPNSMVIDKNNHLWVLCSGGYNNVEIPSLWKIDPATHTILDTLFFPNNRMSPVSLELDPTKDTLYYVNNGIYKLPVNATELPEEPFIIQDQERYYMTLGVDPVNGDLYMSNPLDYQTNGIIYRTNSLGKFKQSITVGLVPGAFGFNY